MTPSCGSPLAAVVTHGAGRQHMRREFRQLPIRAPRIVAIGSTHTMESGVRHAVVAISDP